MIESIEAALERGDYGEATHLLNSLDEQDPWTQLYWAKLWEAQHHFQQAEATYRTLLRQADSSKITLAARQGLERLKTQQTQAREQVREQALTQALQDPHKTEAGILLLEAIAGDQKIEAARAMAEILNIDPYSARLQLPGRGMRLYRTGPIGELEFYGKQLQAKGIPAQWITLAQLQTMPVYAVLYFEKLDEVARVIVQGDHKDANPESLSFAWTEVTGRVEGQLPIFEEVVDRDVQGKLLRRAETQDHANFCDLHLPKRGYILRFSDAAYQFNKGVSLINSSTIGNTTASTYTFKRSTAFANWRQLTQVLEQKLPHPRVWSEFESFAETVFDYPELLSKLPSHINLFRREDSNWDPAFQLYSSLIFCLHSAQAKP